MKKKVGKSGAKKASFASPDSPPTFPELMHAAAIAQYERTQAEILHELKKGGKKPLQCKKCKAKYERKSIKSHICPECPGVVYTDEVTGVALHVGAGVLTTTDQTNRLTSARSRIAEARALMPSEAEA